MNSFLTFFNVAWQDVFQHFCQFLQEYYVDHDENNPAYSGGLNPRVSTKGECWALVEVSSQPSAILVVYRSTTKLSP